MRAAVKSGTMEATTSSIHDPRPAPMNHPEEMTPSSVRMRLNPEQQLWLLRGEDGSYLAAGHSQAGRVLLAWTTRDERLEERAPDLFRAHHPVQRSIREAIETAHRLGCRLRIDEYVVEGFHVPSPSEGEGG
jgi:hypothetical protein